MLKKNCSQFFKDEIIGHNKTDPHECNPNSVQSAELIKKDTKPCPNCGIRIFKISGCDQMWCTECEVTFSWNTGSILTNVHVHNPHFYERQRQINNGNIPRAPGDVLCGGLCSYQSLRMHIILNIDGLAITRKITDWHRFVGHITGIDLVHTRQRIQHLNNNEQLIIEYIMGEKTREQLATTLVRNDGTRKKLVELLNLYELLSVVGIESFAFLINGNLKEKPKKEVLDIINNQYNDYLKLVDYCNREFRIISTNYSCMVPQIKLNEKNVPHQQNDFNMVSQRFTSKEIEIKNEKVQLRNNNNNEASCSYH